MAVTSESSRSDLESDPEVLGIDHVGIAVAELDPAVAFYTDTLGLHEVHREHNPAMGVAEVMLAPGRPVAGPGPTAQIQLLAPLSPQSPIARFLDRSGPGIQHLAYRVRNLDHATRVLQKKGLRLLYDAARTGTLGSRINFVHPKDAGGVLIELVEAAAAHDPESAPGHPDVVSDPGGSQPDRAADDPAPIS